MRVRVSADCLSERKKQTHPPSKHGGKTASSSLTCCHNIMMCCHVVILRTFKDKDADRVVHVHSAVIRSGLSKCVFMPQRPKGDFDLCFRSCCYNNNNDRNGFCVNRPDKKKKSQVTLEFILFLNVC